MENEKQSTQSPDKKPVCGIVMPISAIDDCSVVHWEEVKAILCEAIDAAGYVSHLVSDADDSGVIQKRIVQNLYDNEIVVCDVSCKNPNVMFELGMRLAFDKPTIVVMDNMTKYSFDTAPIEHLVYPRNLAYFEIIKFKQSLSNKIVGTIQAAKEPNYTTFLKHFGEFKVATIKSKKGSYDEVILSKLEDMWTEILTIKNNQKLPSDIEVNSDCISRIYRRIKQDIKEFCNKNNIDEDNIDDEAKKKLYFYLMEHSYKYKSNVSLSLFKKIVEDLI